MNETLNATSPTETPQPQILDVRPIFEKGGTPCGAIDQAVASLRPGQSLVLLVPFEPVPLYKKLESQGLHANPQKQPDGVWRITFTPKTAA